MITPRADARLGSAAYGETLRRAGIWLTRASRANAGTSSDQKVPAHPGTESLFRDLPLRSASLVLAIASATALNATVASPRAISHTDCVIGCVKLPQRGDDVRAPAKSDGMDPLFEDGCCGEGRARRPGCGLFLEGTGIGK